MKIITRRNCCRGLWNKRYRGDLAILAKSIADYAFEKSKCRDIFIYHGMGKIGKYAFRNSLIREIELPDSIYSIGDGAFAGCTLMNHCGLSNGMSTIPANAFKDCIGLMEITIPKNIDYIQEGAFAGCTNLKKVIFEGPVLIEKGAFDMCINLNNLDEVNAMTVI